ncbi:MAG: hypothetical protein EBW21_06995, partial [Actinobacteria bacterium]|nr:hypothetical protein [Actinomycetota bacterium]
PAIKLYRFNELCFSLPISSNCLAAIRTLLWVTFQVSVSHTFREMLSKREINALESGRVAGIFTVNNQMESINVP